MTIKQLSEWVFSHSLPDRWWVSLDGVTEPEAMPLEALRERLKSGEFGEVQVLHVSQEELDPAPWVEVEWEEAAVRGRSVSARSLQGPREVSQSESLGALLLVVPLIAAVGAYGLVSQATLLQGPSMILFAIFFLMVLICGALAAAEVKLAGVNCGKARPDAPVAWLVAMVFFWVVTYPIYLSWRPRYGLKNLGSGGVLVALFVTLTMGVLWWAVDEAKLEALESLRF